jgi:signal transduction histidine kinase/HAMP domain-containing protein
VKAGGESQRVASPMAGSLIWKLYGVLLTVAVVGVAIAGVLVDRSVRQNSFLEVQGRLDSEATMLGQMTASALFGELDPSDSSLNDSVRALGDAVHTQLSVLTPKGVVVADSAAQITPGGAPESDAPEIVAARATVAGIAIRGTEGNERLYVARAIVRDGKVLGFARSSMPMEAVRVEELAVRARMTYGALVASGVAFLLGFMVTRGIVRRVNALADGARSIEAGDYGREIAVRSRDELGELASAFNQMSRSLRKTVEELDRRNRDMRLVLDNVGEGLLTFALGGEMLGEPSAVVEQWFGPARAGLRLWDYVAPHDPITARNFRLHWEQLVEGVMPLEVCIDQMPRRLNREGKLFDLDYTPIMTDDRFEAVLVVVADVTAQEQAMRAEAEQREILAVFECVMRDKDGFLEFLVDADRLVAQISGEPRPSVDVLKTALHTLKGNAGVFGILSVAAMCHQTEDQLRDGAVDIDPASREALQARWAAFTRRLRDLLGERETRSIEIHDDEYETLLNAVLGGIPREEIAQMIADWKLQRVDLRLERFADQTRSIAHVLGKINATVVVDCDSKLRVTRDVMAPFWSSFIHVVRNAADHGLRSPQRDGVSGTIRLAARRAGESLVIEVVDDGPGIDWAVVAQRAASRGLPHQTREDLANALFAEDFTTLAQATATSGRGIGLGVVRRACQALGGSARVESREGQGTTFRFELPLRTVSHPPVVRVSAASQAPQA